MSSYHEICPKCEDETITHGWSPSTCPFCKINQLERELAEAQNILKQCLSIMPVGYVPTHTVENLPEMISDLAKALAEETTEREQLERELAEARKQRDMLAIGLRKLIELDDKMRDPDYDESGTYAGAYYCYYKGEDDTWEGARAALATVKGGDK